MNLLKLHAYYSIGVTEGTELQRRGLGTLVHGERPLYPLWLVVVLAGAAEGTSYLQKRGGDTGEE